MQEHRNAGEQETQEHRRTGNTGSAGEQETQEHRKHRSTGSAGAQETQEMQEHRKHTKYREGNAK